MAYVLPVWSIIMMIIRNIPEFIFKEIKALKMKKIVLFLILTEPLRIKDTMFMYLKFYDSTKYRIQFFKTCTSFYPAEAETG